MYPDVKTKATDLINRFQEQVSRNGHRRKNVINCVLLCIDEILDCYMDGYCSSSRDIEYWERVRSEVSNQGTKDERSVAN